MNTAIKNGQILDNAYGVLGIEFMAAAQALDFRTFTPGNGDGSRARVIRKHVAHLDVDRPLFNDHNTMKALVKSGDILDDGRSVSSARCCSADASCRFPGPRSSPRRLRADSTTMGRSACRLSRPPGRPRSGDHDADSVDPELEINIAR